MTSKINSRYESPNRGKKKKWVIWGTEIKPMGWVRRKKEEDGFEECNLMGFVG